MQLGFVSAIFPDLSLEQVLAFAADEGFGCVELMCWPPGEADRRYAGVTHLDVTRFTPADAARTLADGIPGAKLQTLPAAGHLSNLEAPVEFNAAVREFLTGL